jgi:hypothetical protein
MVIARKTANANCGKGSVQTTPAKRSTGNGQQLPGSETAELLRTWLMETNRTELSPSSSSGSRSGENASPKSILVSHLSTPEVIEEIPNLQPYKNGQDIALPILPIPNIVGSKETTKQRVRQLNQRITRCHERYRRPGRSLERHRSRTVTKLAHKCITCRPVRAYVPLCLTTLQLEYARQSKLWWKL